MPEPETSDGGLPAGCLYELRARKGHANRLLYFFHGRGVAVLTHGVKKEDVISDSSDFERALRWKRAFEEDPDSHTYLE